MDKNLRAINLKRLERTVAALRKNKFEAELIPAREALITRLGELIPAGASCSVGGSMSLFETGVVDFLKNGDYDYLDRYAEGADQQAIYHKAFNCHTYLSSANAITEQGEIYNIDGRGNRVAAMIYGPEKVIVIAGVNKIVPDLEAARVRRRFIAAPANAVRLETGTPCAATGKCEDCLSARRMCNFEVVTSFQGVPGRITVLLMPEELGY